MTVDVSSGHSEPPISLGCAVTTTTSDPASWKFKCPLGEASDVPLAQRPHHVVTIVAVPVVVGKDLGDAGGLFQGGEVSGVAKRNRSGATEHGEVGLAVWQTRPVVIAVDQSDRGGDTTVERSGGNHAVHIAEDFARHARIAATTANPAQLGEIMIWELAAVEQPAPQHDAQDRLVFHPRDHRADCREACTADVDRGDAIGSTDAFGVVVRVEGGDASHAVFELG